MENGITLAGCISKIKLEAIYSGNKPMLSIKTFHDKIAPWPKLVLQVGLFIGFLLVSLYFLSIGYFPIQDLGSFTAILFYQAFLSSVVLVMLLILLCMAPYLWIKILLANVKTCDWIVGRSSLQEICIIANNEETKNKKISRYVNFRIFIIYFLLVLAYVGFSFYLNIKNYSKLQIFLLCVGILSGILSLILFPSLRHNYQEIIDKIEHQKKLRETSFWNCRLNFINFSNTIIVSVACGFLVFIAGFIMQLFIYSSENRTHLFFIIYFPLVLLTGYGVVINNSMEKLKTSIVCVGLMILSFSLTRPHAIENLTKLTLKKSNLGSFDASLEIDNIACAIFKKINLILYALEEIFPSLQIKFIFYGGVTNII